MKESARRAVRAQRGQTNQRGGTLVGTQISRVVIDVGIDKPRIGGVRQLVDGVFRRDSSGSADPRVIDQYVEAAEVRLDPTCGFMGTGLVGDVQDDGVHVIPCRAHLGGRRFAATGIPCPNHDGRPLRGELFRTRDVTNRWGHLVRGVKRKSYRERVLIMRVFVAGGSGTVGRHVVPLLVARSHEVWATTTSAGKLDMLARLGARPVLMDGLDAHAVKEAVARAEPEVVVHEMTAISGTPDIKHFDQWFAMTNRLRTEGTDNLLAAAEATGGSHVIAQSYAAWNGIRKGGWVKTEADPLDPTSTGNASTAIRHLEDAVVRAGGAALRYGALYGPGAIDDQVDLVRRHQYPIIGHGNGHTSWVHLDDAASATVLAVESSAQGVFNIVDDDPAAANEWLPHLAASAGAKPPMRLPIWLARPFAGRTAVIMMTEGRGFSNAKAKRDLGWRLRHPSWRQGFPAVPAHEVPV